MEREKGGGRRGEGGSGGRGRGRDDLGGKRKDERVLKD